METILKESRPVDLAFFQDYADFMRQQLTALGKDKADLRFYSRRSSRREHPVPPR